MATVEFNQLPLPARQAFLQFTQRAGKELGYAELNPWGVVKLALLIPATMVLSMALYVGTGVSGLGTGVLVALVALWLRRRFLGPPWRPGWYLFPSVIVDARTPTLHFHAIPAYGARGLQLIERHRKGGGFLSATIEAWLPGVKYPVFFDAGGGGRDSIVARWQQFCQQREWVAFAQQQRDWAYLATLDPFTSCLEAGSWIGGPPDVAPLAQLPGPRSLAACLALGVAVALPALLSSASKPAAASASQPAAPVRTATPWDDLAASPEAAAFLASVEKTGKLVLRHEPPDDLDVNWKTYAWTDEAPRLAENLQARLDRRGSQIRVTTTQSAGATTLVVRLRPRVVMRVDSLRGKPCPITAFDIELLGDGDRLLARTELPPAGLDALEAKAAGTNDPEACRSGQIQDVLWRASEFEGLLKKS